MKNKKIIILVIVAVLLFVSLIFNLWLWRGLQVVSPPANLPSLFSVHFPNDAYDINYDYVERRMGIGREKAEKICSVSFSVRLLDSGGEWTVREKIKSYSPNFAIKNPPVEYLFIVGWIECDYSSIPYTEARCNGYRVDGSYSDLYLDKAGSSSFQCDFRNDN